jgi:adenylate cyclase
MKKLLMGRYHSPGQEERIFMFLDLKSSTTITEQIGDELYFRMLRFFYEVANKVVANHYGEIYQYVGDEIVVSWEQSEGLREARCLRCFTAVEEAIKQHATLFRDEFGVVPSFKAGVHTGKVATGAIGSLKKDIVYSGDVLNTTARIVALCNQYQSSLIISETLYKSLNNPPGYRFRHLDNPVLKGKSAPMSLYAVEITGG